MQGEAGRYQAKSWVKSDPWGDFFVKPDSTLDQSEILAAFRLLFSPEYFAGMRAVDSLQQDQLKSAYRKMALSTHPDRFASQGEAVQRVHAERFIQVSRAYEILSRYVALRQAGGRWTVNDSTGAEHAGRRPAKAASRARSTSTSVRGEKQPGASTGSFWQRGLPRRYLRFGEFLYFSRVITWRSLVDALVWQRRQRPRIGEIARKWRWVNDSQVDAAVRDRRPGERIGEVLLRHGLVTPLGLGALLRQQQKIQKPIGLYFVRHGGMSEHEVGRHLYHQRRHNVQFASAFAASPHN